MLGRLLVASAKVTVVVVAVVECCGGGDCGNDGGGGGGGCTSVFELKSFHPVMPRIHTRNAGERTNVRARLFVFRPLRSFSCRCCCRRHYRDRLTATAADIDMYLTVKAVSAVS